MAFAAGFPWQVKTKPGLFRDLELKIGSAF